MTRYRIGAAAAILIGTIALSGTLGAQEPPLTWDGLVAVKATRMDVAYLMPGADFRPYTKVMFDPTEVALKKNWLRDYNMSSMSSSRRITDADVEKAFATIRTKFGDVFAKTFSGAGYQVVSAPGPDVLRVRTGVINLSVSAPDNMSAGRSRTYAREAGEATLVIEVRDSQSGALLGRAVDRRLAGDTPMLLRNSVTNRSDFSRLFADWAKESVAGLNELKAISVVDFAEMPSKVGNKN